MVVSPGLLRGGVGVVTHDGGTALGGVDGFPPTFITAQLNSASDADQIAPGSSTIASLTAGIAVSTSPLIDATAGIALFSANDFSVP